VLVPVSVSVVVLVATLTALVAVESDATHTGAVVMPVEVKLYVCEPPDSVSLPAMSVFELVPVWIGKVVPVRVICGADIGSVDAMVVPLSFTCDEPTVAVPVFITKSPLAGVPETESVPPPAPQALPVEPSTPDAQVPQPLVITLVSEVLPTETPSSSEAENWPSPIWVTLSETAALFLFPTVAINWGELPESLTTRKLDRTT